MMCRPSLLLAGIGANARQLLATGAVRGSPVPLTRSQQASAIVWPLWQAFAGRFLWDC